MARYDNERHKCWECSSREDCKYLIALKLQIDEINNKNWNNNIDIGVGPLVTDCTYFARERKT